MKHTQEPWRVGDAGHTVFGPPNGNPSPKTIATDLRGDDSRRIVACVNACAGIEDPAAELARLRRVEGAAREVLRDHDERFSIYPEKNSQPHKLLVVDALRSALEDSSTFADHDCGQCGEAWNGPATDTCIHCGSALEV